MAHNIIKGIDRMASTRTDTVWHADETLRDGRLVQVVASDPESTLLNMAAIVWPSDADNDVHRTVKLQTVEGTGVPSHVATVSRSGRILGVVTDSYTVVPFKAILTEWLHAMALAGGAPETLGTFDAGESFFSSFLVAPEWRVPGDKSITRAICNVTANHAGKGGIRSSFSTFRVVCKNTSMMYAEEHDAIQASKEKADAAWVTIQHTAGAFDAMREAVKWITDGKARAEKEEAMLARLAAKVVAKSEVDAFIENYIDIPGDASKRTSGLRNAERALFEADINAEDLGDHAQQPDGSITAYGLLQGVTHFEDWTSRTVARKDEDIPVNMRRAFRAFLGKRETEKATARERIMALAS